MRRLVLFALAAFFFVTHTTDTDGQMQSSVSTCPVQAVHFNPSGLSVRVENTSGKKIVGMTWFAAIADATEHWNWIYWNLPGPLRLREFNWNKEVKSSAKKTLDWSYADLDFQHASGGAFILGSVLFSDGTRWEGIPADHVCQVLWLESNKKAFARPEELPH
jgi:N-acetylneuraminic acid mutarotase